MSYFLVGGLVSVRVGVKGGRIHDSLVLHQLVKLGVCKSEQLVLFGVSDNVVAFHDLGLTWFLLRLLDFVQHVLTHDFIIQLGFALTVEPEAPHFAFHVTLLGLVAVILGTARHEFHDVIVGVQFTGKLAEVIAQDRVGLSRFLQVNDRVGVIVEDAFPQLFQRFVEAETGPTGGETGDEDVEVGCYRNVFVLILEMDLYHGVVHDGDVTHVRGIGIQELVKGLEIIKGFDLGLVETLSELASHGIEHHLH